MMKVVFRRCYLMLVFLEHFVQLIEMNGLLFGPTSMCNIIKINRIVFGYKCNDV